MQPKPEMRIKTPVPFLQDRTVLYVGDGAERAELPGRFRDAGYKFLFLPELAESLGPALLGYMCPGNEGPVSVEDMYRRVRDLAGLGERTGFLYKRNGVTRFCALPDSSPGRGAGFASEAFEKHFSTSRPPVLRSRKRAPDPVEESYDGLEEGGVFYDALECPVPEAEEPLDARTQQILRAWEQIEREYGITIEDLDIILGYRVKLSRLSISTAGRIVLTDWDGRPEVRMDDLTKALYFFYLRHPEGVALKGLTTYRDEILRYYAGITGRDDPKAIAESVDKLLSPFDNNLNVSISRIKKAFRDIVGERVARFYYVDGRYAEARRVALDRDLVIWEH